MPELAAGRRMGWMVILHGNGKIRCAWDVKGGQDCGGATRQAANGLKAAPSGCCHHRTGSQQCKAPRDDRMTPELHNPCLLGLLSKLPFLPHATPPTFPQPLQHTKPTTPPPPPFPPASPRRFDSTYSLLHSCFSYILPGTASSRQNRAGRF